MRAQFVFGEVWIGLRRNLTMTAALVVVVAISLSLLGTGLLFVKQVDHTRSLWQSRLELSVYLCSAVNPDQACAKNGPVTSAEKQQIYTTLHRLPQVVDVSFQSQAEAFKQAKQLFANEPVMLDFVQPGDLPASFIVKMKNAQADAVPVTQAVTGQPGVDSVGDDAAILTKFYQLLDGARNAVIVVAIILIVAAILLVANTIRLSAFNRRRETAIMRLVGASNFYVQLPFLVEGMIAGLFGWLISVALLTGARTGLDGLQQYFPFPVQLSAGDLIEVVLVTMLIGVVLCGATSFLTLRRYLRV
ncbi:MAG TPA: permease-like cell division protein FtsX [Streptosporangiaceae bacterium]|jgi:cell division transport system permease protein|nr:permease-like cell division protein FtsX [Streptosporangiaceae bacterium]